MLCVPCVVCRVWVSRVVCRDVPCPLGVSGIRTHDGSLHFCFQDRRIRPLCHHAFPLSFLLFPSPLLLFVFLHFLLFFLCFPFFSLIYFLFFPLIYFLFFPLIYFRSCYLYSDFAFELFLLLSFYCICVILALPVPNILPLLLSPSIDSDIALVLISCMLLYLKLFPFALPLLVLLL